MTIHFTTLFLLHFVTYWSVSIFFLVVDWFCLDKSHNNWKKYPKAIKTSLVNQLTISLPTVYLCDNLINSALDTNSNSWFLYGFKIFLLVNLSNIFFYITHRLLHTKWIYKMIHYKHHEFIEPVACATLYAHPIEHLFSNVLSFIVPFILIGTTYYTMLCLIFIGTLISMIAHIQYKILPTPNNHLVHHKLYKYNYGFGDYLDILFGTYI